MNARYQVVVVHKDMERLRAEVVESVKEAATGVLHDLDLLTFPRRISDVDDRFPVAVIYLGNVAGATDSDVCGHIEIAVRRQFPILPVVLGDVANKLPALISTLNAKDWTSNRSEVTGHLLAMLALTERERKIFVSYVQKESTELAVQLHDALTKAHFDVFLDLFAILPGQDIRQRIERDLGDKAFVLLLESASISKSTWVQREVVYALTHGIEILSVAVPALSRSQLIPSVDEGFRIRLNHKDIANGRLTDARLHSVLTRIEQAHAGALRRRREQTFGSITKQMERCGCEWRQVGDWSIVAIGPQGLARVIMAKPREASPADLRALHCTQQQVCSANGRFRDASATLVHRGANMADDDRGLLEWIAEPRELGMATLDDFVGGGAAGG